jgi:hypothetical protein
VAGSCECDNEPSGSINFLTSRGRVSFSGKTLLHGVIIIVIIIIVMNKLLTHLHRSLGS